VLLKGFMYRAEHLGKCYCCYCAAADPPTANPSMHSSGLCTSAIWINQNPVKRLPSGTETCTWSHALIYILNPQKLRCLLWNVLSISYLGEQLCKHPNLIKIRWPPSYLLPKGRQTSFFSINMVTFTASENNISLCFSSPSSWYKWFGLVQQFCPQSGWYDFEVASQCLVPFVYTCFGCSCKWNGVPCKPGDLKEIMTDIGRCAAFNVNPENPLNSSSPGKTNSHRFCSQPEFLI
jgi:hypothetical protein